MGEIEKHIGTGSYIDNLAVALSQRDPISVELFVRGAESAINLEVHLGKTKEAYEIYQNCFGLTSIFINDPTLDLSLRTEDGIRTQKIIASIFKLCHDGIKFGWQKKLDVEQTQKQLDDILSWCNKFSLEEERWKAVNNMLILATTSAIALPPQKARTELQDILTKYNVIIRNVSKFTRGAGKVNADFLLWAKIRNNVGQVWANLAFANMLLGDDIGTKESLEQALKELEQSSLYVSLHESDEGKLAQIRAASNMRFVEYIAVLHAIKSGEDYTKHLDRFTNGLRNVINTIHQADPRVQKIFMDELGAEIHRRMFEGTIAVLLIDREGSTHPLRELLASFYTEKKVEVKMEHMYRFALAVYKRAERSAQESSPDDIAELNRTGKTSDLFGLKPKRPEQQRVQVLA